MTRKECITNLFLLGFKKSIINKDPIDRNYYREFTELKSPIQHIYTKGVIQVNLLYSKDTFVNGHISKYIGNVGPYVQSFITYNKLIDNVIERLK